MRSFIVGLALLAGPVKVDSLESFRRERELAAAGYTETAFTAVASSTLCEGTGPGKRCHDVDRLSDDDVATGWCEGAPGSGAGQQLTLTFEREVTVGGLDLQPFFGKSFKLAKSNARPAMLTVRSQNVSHSFALEDVVATVEAQNEDRPRSTEDGPCGDETCASRDERLPTMRLTLALPKPVTTKTLTVRVDAAFEGARFADLCLSELRVFAK